VAKYGHLVLSRAAADERSGAAKAASVVGSSMDSSGTVPWAHVHEQGQRQVENWGMRAGKLRAR
jgi:hypothetical protein